MAKHWRAVLLLAFVSCGDRSLTELEAAARCGRNLKFYHPDHAEWVGMDRRTSNELLVGRTMKLAADRYSRDQWGWSPLGVTGISWCSAAPNIVKVEGDSAVALSAGSATLFAFDDQGRGDSLTVHVMKTGFSLTLVQEGASGVQLNDSGDVVGTTPTSSFIWHDGSITDLGNCVPTDINDRRQVTCRSRSGAVPRAYVWNEGNVTPVTIGDLVVQLRSINDSGDIAAFAYEGIGFNPAGYLIIGSDTLRFTEVVYVGHVNNRRQLAAQKLRFGHDPQAALLTKGGVSFMPGGRHDLAYMASDSNKVVGYFHGRGQVVWTLTPGGVIAGDLGPAYTAVVNPISGVAQGVNNASEIVGTAHGVGFLWRNQRSIVLTNVLLTPDWIVTTAYAINDRSEILAQATNTKTGVIGPVLLRPAQLP